MSYSLGCSLSRRLVLDWVSRIAIACWDALERNPFLSLPIEIISNHIELPETPADEPGAFANPVRLHNFLKTTGFTNIEIEQMEFDVIEVDDGRAYWEVLSDLSAPIMSLVRQLNESARNDFVNEVIETADLQRAGDTLRMTGTTWLAAASR